MLAESPPVGAGVGEFQAALSDKGIEPVIKTVSKFAMLAADLLALTNPIGGIPCMHLVIYIPFVQLAFSFCKAKYCRAIIALASEISPDLIIDMALVKGITTTSMSSPSA